VYSSEIEAILETLRKERICIITRRTNEPITNLWRVQEKRLRYTLSLGWFKPLALFGTAHRRLICTGDFCRNSNKIDTDLLLSFQSCYSVSAIFGRRMVYQFNVAKGDGQRHQTIFLRTTASPGLDTGYLRRVAINVPHLGQNTWTLGVLLCRATTNLSQPFSRILDIDLYVRLTSLLYSLRVGSDHILTYV